MTERQITDLLARVLGVEAEELIEITLDLPGHYRVKQIETNGKNRTLHIPSTRLKSVQKLILRRVLGRIPSHPASHCAPRRSILTNARHHIGSKYVTTMDVEDAFPSARPHLIRAALTRGLARARLDPRFAGLVVQLCTFRGQLPQGAPTSPKLLDLTLYRVDSSLTAAAARHGVRYTRYVDDFCVSGGKVLGFFVRLVGAELGRCGLRLKRVKQRDYGPGKRATVTGLVLGKRPILRSDYVSAVKGLVEGHLSGACRIRPEDVVRLLGRIAWIKQVHPRIGASMGARMRADKGDA